MADISAEIAAFQNAVYGEDVRSAMISLANKVNNESSAAATTVAGYDMRLSIVEADDVKSALTLTKASETNIWEQGAIQSPNGDNSSSTTRIRTKTYLYQNVTEVSVLSGYKYIVFAYNATTKAYVGVWNGTSLTTSATWFTNSVSLTKIGNYLFRLVAANTSDTTITSANATNVVFNLITDTSLSAEGKSADAKEVGDKINALNADVNYTLNEIQQYANAGYQRLAGFWELGDINNGIERKLSYRARMSDIEVYPYDISVKTESGYDGWYDVFTSQGVYDNSQISITTTEVVIPANTYFRAVIRKNPENTSTTIDPYEFASKLKVKTYVQQEIDTINAEILERDKAILRNNYLQYGRTTINSDYVRGIVIATGTYAGVLSKNYRYRVASNNIVYTNKRIYLTIYDPSLVVNVFFYSSYSQSDYLTFRTTNIIPAGSYFRIVISINPEDTTRVLSQNEVDTIWNSVGFASYQKQIVELNADQEQMVYNLSKGRSTRFDDEYGSLEFIHFSDIHKNAEAWMRICDYMDKHSSVIPFALHTGDYVMASQEDWEDLYAVQEPKNGYILNCVGNHDYYKTLSPTTYATAAETYGIVFEGHISDWGVTFGSATNAMYYYKDFNNSGIRLIVLDQYYWNSTQSTWFENLLADAKVNDFAVVTAAHQITAGVPNNKRVDCTFNSIAGWTAELSESVAPEIETLITAFKAAGGEHICHLSGHYHHDIVGYTANDVLNIIVECATSNASNWGDSERVYGTRGQDCFNVVSFDRNLHIIRLVRIGNNCDYYGREKNILCYDYQNKTVIANT